MFASHAGWRLAAIVLVGWFGEWCLIAETTPEQIEKLIVGQWTYEGKRSGAKITSLATFKPGGAYACAMAVSFLGTQSKITFDGTWEVLDGDDVVIKVTKTSNRFLLPVGKLIKKVAVSFEDGVMKYQHDGKDEKETRVKPKPDKDVSP